MSSALRRLHRDERGQALVLVAIFLLGLIAVAGLVADGGLVLAQRRDLQNAADAAAAAGAMQLDEDHYRATAGAEVALDEDAAYEAAAQHLAAEGDAVYSIGVGEERVEVEVSRSANTAFLRLLGIESVTIMAEASAEPRHGVLAAAP